MIWLSIRPSMYYWNLAERIKRFPFLRCARLSSGCGINQDIMVGDDRMAVVIWYVLATSLTEVLDFVASLVVEFHRRMVLGGLQLAFSCFSFLGQRQLSSATVIAMGLSQVIHGPTHNSGHLPEPIFLSEQRKDVLNFWKLLVSALSWLNYSLMSLQFSDTTLLHWKPISIRMVHHRWLMDLIAEGRLELFQKVWYMI